MRNWGSQMGNLDRVPSLISYTQAKDPLDQQWGASISEGSVVIRHTKKGLGTSTNRKDELKLIPEAFDESINLDFEHMSKTSHDRLTRKESIEVATDYLTKIFQNFNNLALFGHHLRASLLNIDIVVTVPAVRRCQLPSPLQVL